MWFVVGNVCYVCSLGDLSNLCGAGCGTLDWQGHSGCAGMDVSIKFLCDDEGLDSPQAKEAEKEELG
ncbi:hypothetical protein E6O75_ATG01472 [Venturia nashicola]|uniref:Uncharacterized protein n=1 Tax=Venturia nashicola TaxID=86259 RepID=A0A4Z1PVE4_9PEZI|nr:hypothetical protein E6O75_ATG01472 [Venturia nashicola]